jgi:hypothetical protein
MVDKRGLLVDEAGLGGIAAGGGGAGGYHTIPQVSQSVGIPVDRIESVRAS